MRPSAARTRSAVRGLPSCHSGRCILPLRKCSFGRASRPINPQGRHFGSASVVVCKAKPADGPLALILDPVGHSVFQGAVWVADLLPLLTKEHGAQTDSDDVDSGELAWADLPQGYRTADSVTVYDIPVQWPAEAPAPGSGVSLQTVPSSKAAVVISPQLSVGTAPHLESHVTLSIASSSSSSSSNDSPRPSQRVVCKVSQYRDPETKETDWFKFAATQNEWATFRKHALELQSKHLVQLLGYSQSSSSISVVSEFCSGGDLQQWSDQRVPVAGAWGSSPGSPTTLDVQGWDSLTGSGQSQEAAAILYPEAANSNLTSGPLHGAQAASSALYHDTAAGPQGPGEYAAPPSDTHILAAGSPHVQGGYTAPGTTWGSVVRDGDGVSVLIPLPIPEAAQLIGRFDNITPISVDVLHDTIMSDTESDSEGAEYSSKRPTLPQAFAAAGKAEVTRVISVSPGGEAEVMRFASAVTDQGLDLDLERDSLDILHQTVDSDNEALDDAFDHGTVAQQSVGPAALAVVVTASVGQERWRLLRAWARGARQAAGVVGRLALGERAGLLSLVMDKADDNNHGNNHQGTVGPVSGIGACRECGSHSCSAAPQPTITHPHMPASVLTSLWPVAGPQGRHMGHVGAQGTSRGGHNVGHVGAVTWAHGSHTVRSPRMSEPQVAHVALHVIGALAALHRAGLVHGDIKPANVFISPTASPSAGSSHHQLSNSDVFKLGDFGTLRESGRQHLHYFVAGFGFTPEYASPEALRHGTAKAGLASDLWSLGIMMQQLLLGRLPSTAVAMARLHEAGATHECEAYLRTHPPGCAAMRELADARVPVSPALEHVLRACLQVSPRDRPRDAVELMEMEWFQTGTCAQVEALLDRQGWARKTIAHGPASSHSATAHAPTTLASAAQKTTVFV